MIVAANSIMIVAALTEVSEKFLRSKVAHVVHALALTARLFRRLSQIYCSALKDPTVRLEN